MRRRLAALPILFLGTCALADGPQDNQPAQVRPIPPPGIEVPGPVRAELQAGLDALGRNIADLSAKDHRKTAALLPDVRIFHEAVRVALTYGEFFEEKEFDRARKLLAEGAKRAEQLGRGEAPWTEAAGLVVRGYVSKIDGSVQPYGLVVPESYTPRTAGRYRLDIWFHGRGEKLSEVNFLDERTRVPGQFTPADTIVLHPYGRYCNAFKFAGEVDVLEALEDVKARYRVDEDRISVRGFSMGGAACWQFAVHYADRWFAANPGAGFAETRQFLEQFQREKLEPTHWEEMLWHLYDCPDWAYNLWICPTIAYSGENDRQKQAADVMAKTLMDEGRNLTHIIGPRTAHSYHPESAREVEQRLRALTHHGRPFSPAGVGMVTYTLRYNRMHWLTIDGLIRHWDRAWVSALQQKDKGIVIETQGVTALTLQIPSGWCDLQMEGPVPIRIEGQDLTGPHVGSDVSWTCHLERGTGRWRIVDSPPSGLVKRPRLQGPIDDAFMDSFVFVLPTGEGRHSAINEWVAAESQRAIREWRRQFRGEARVKKDTEITDEDIAGANLVLWGDPQSNAVLKRIAEKLPIGWADDAVKVGDRSFDAAHHVPLLIYPNPLNHERYVVLNSGFTYREYDYLNNARQVPKLPDWAIIDVRTPPDARRPGKIVAADFFGERWELKPAE